MRTADRLIAGRHTTGARRDPMVPLVQALLPRIPVIVADNVAAYVHGRSEEWKLEELPCMAPPWNSFWIEYPNEGTERRGVLCFDVTAAADWHSRGQSLPLVDDFLIAESDTHPTVRDSIVTLSKKAVDNAHAYGDMDSEGFLIAMVLFIDNQREVSQPVGWYSFSLDRLGHVEGNRWQLDPDASKLHEQGEIWLLHALRPAFQAIAFLHCRNVKVDTVHPPVKLAKKRERKSGVRLVSYKTIRLEVPRRASGTSEGSGSGGPPSLHIVSGNYHHYGDCCPIADGCPGPHGDVAQPGCANCGGHLPHGKLFGRLEGVYWVPGHARGDAQRGVVKTDFELNVSA